MSLNKLTLSTQKGLDLGLKIGAEEIQCENLITRDFNVSNIDAVNVDVSNSLKVGTLTYPTLDNTGTDFTYPTNEGTGTLVMRPSLPHISWGYLSSSATGISLSPLPTYPAFLAPDTAYDTNVLPLSFYTTPDNNITIVRNGSYRVVATCEVLRAVADPSFHCAILKNGTHIQTTGTNRGTTLPNTRCSFSLTSYIDCVAGDKLSVGLSGTTGGAVIFEFWRLDIEFIR